MEMTEEMINKIFDSDSLTCNVIKKKIIHSSPEREETDFWKRKDINELRERELQKDKELHRKDIKYLNCFGEFINKEENNKRTSLETLIKEKQINIDDFL